MECISQHTGLYQVKNIYEVEYFCLDGRDTEEPNTKKNRGVTFSLFSVLWIEDEQQSLFSVAFSQNTGLCTVNITYVMDFPVLVHVYSTVSWLAHLQEEKNSAVKKQLT